jgi:hypothetical protein
MKFRLRVSLLALSAILFVITLGIVRHKKAFDGRSTPQQDIASPQPSIALRPETDFSSQAGFSSAALAEISQLDGTITLGQWKMLHSDYKPKAEQPGYTCPGLEKTVNWPSGSRVTIRAYFYPPPVPASVTMPALIGEALMDPSCTLAKIRVEVPAPTEEIGFQLEESLKQEFSRKYGNYALPDKKSAFFGGAYWKDQATWKAGEIEVVSAYGELPAEIRSSEPLADPDTVFVFARLPIVASLDHELCCTIPDYYYRLAEDQQFHRAVELSGLDQALRQRVDELYENVYGAYAGVGVAPSNRDWAPKLVPVLEDWLNAEKSVSPHQRAAALFAADRLLAALEDTDGFEIDAKRSKAPLRSQLVGLGAEFPQGPVGEYGYGGNWLKEARELDPDGEVNEMAVLVSISHHSCDPDDVIRQADGLLAKGLNGPTEERVHFILGNAYADIVGLAEGVNPDIDASPWKGRAEIARSEALDEYRSVLSADTTSEMARDAWRQAWNLSAGLLPRSHYVCGDL